MGNLSNYSEMASSWSSVASALVATVALIFTAVQIREARRSSRETAAIQAMSAYFRRCAENPHLGSWEHFSSWNENVNHPSALYADTGLKSETYLWFLSELLFMCELVLSSKAGGSMAKTLETQLDYHRDSLKYLWKEQNWAEEYPPNVRKFVSRSLGVKP